MITDLNQVSDLSPSSPLITEGSGDRHRLLHARFAQDSNSRSRSAHFRNHHDERPHSCGTNRNEPPAYNSHYGAHSAPPLHRVDGSAPNNHALLVGTLQDAPNGR